MSKKASYKGKKLFATYKTKGSFIANRKIKIERHLKAHPEDTVAQAAIKAPGAYRKAPESKGGWIKDDVKFFYGKQNTQVMGRKLSKDIAQINKLCKKVAMVHSYSGVAKPKAA